MRMLAVRALRRLISSERGNAMIVVLGFMALTLPVVTGALAFAATASNSARVARADTASSFTLAGAGDYAVFKLLHVAGFKESLTAGVPYAELLPINGEDAVVSWTKRAGPGATTPPALPTVFTTTKTVDTTMVAANTPTTVTYTIEVTNTGSATATVDEIRDGLPPFVDYVDNTTTGETTANPIKSVHDSGQTWVLFRQLVWDIGVSLGPMESLSISFDAEINAPDGYYCNVAWANPGGQDAGSGPTAKIQAGTPLSMLCDNQAVAVRKAVTPAFAASGVPTTFRYRIELENLGAINQDIFTIVDVMPPGISIVTGTIESDITVQNPALKTPDDQQEAKWVDGLLTVETIVPGQTVYIEFDATGSLASGDYENQVWVSFQAVGEAVYSFPTARIAVYDVYDIAIANGQTSLSTQVWVGADGDYRVTEWEQSQP
jgi:uncharacterized repeat protein (TIGR01451 family)